MLGWSSLANQRTQQKAIIMHKINNGTAPSYLTEMCQIPEASVHNLRSSSENIKLPKVHSESYKRSFAVSGTMVWNSLPDSLKQVKNQKTLIKSIKSLH